MVCGVLLAGLVLGFWLRFVPLFPFIGVAFVALMWDRGPVPNWISMTLLVGMVSLLMALMGRPVHELVVVLGTIVVPLLWRLRTRFFNDRLIRVLMDVAHHVSEAQEVEEAARIAVRDLMSIGARWYVSVFLHRRDDDVLSQVAASDNFQLGLELPRGRGVVWRAFMEGRPVLVKDVSSDPAYVPSGAEVRSEVAVPLQIGGRRLGVLNVESPFELKRRDLWFVSIIASLLSYVISSMEARRAPVREGEPRVKPHPKLVRMVRMRQHGKVAEALLSIMGAPSALMDLDGLCRRIVEAVASMGYPNVYLLVQDQVDGDRVFILKAFKGLPQSDSVRVLSPDRLEGIWGWVVREASPYLCNDTSCDPLYRTGHERIRSELAVPILSSAGEVVGLLDLQDHRKGRFNQEDVHLMEDVCRYLGFMLEHSYHVRELESRMREMRLLHDIVREMSFTGSLEDMVRSVVNMVADRLGYRSVTIFKVETAEGGVSVMSSSNRYDDVEAVNRVLSKGTSLVARAARNGVMQNTRDVSKAREWIPLIPTVRSQLDVPIAIHGRIYGVLCIEDDHVGAFGPQEEETFSILAGHVAVAWRLLELVDRVKTETQRDSLTGVANIRKFKVTLAEMLSRAKREDRSFAVVMMDLGNFKDLNDRFGHSAGDEVIKRFAREVDRRTCLGDLFARYGGDEFVLLLWDVDRSRAEGMVRSLKELAGSLDLGVDYRITVDAGVAVYPDDGDDGDQLIRLADERMYNDKRERKAHQGGMAHG